MAKKSGRSGLGQGIGALIPGNNLDEDLSSGIKEVKISEIEPGEGQPRKTFDKDKINALAESIKEHGLIQPIIVSKEKNCYRIIAGERRWRAAKVAGLKTIPVIEREASQREIMELALIENIQREDLNPIEEAEAYEKLMSEYQLTQEQLSSIVSKSRPTIANSLRLLGCDKPIREMLVSGALTAGHARAILGLSEAEERVACAKKVAEEQYSVRQTELYVKKLLYRKQQEENSVTTEPVDVFKSSDIQHVQNQLKSALGTKVKLDDKNGKGKIVIEYYSSDERERLIEYLTKK